MVPKSALWGIGAVILVGWMPFTSPNQLCQSTKELASSVIINTSSAIAAIADRTACSISLRLAKTLMRDFWYF